MNSKKHRSKNIFRIIVLSATAISLFFVPWGILRACVTPLPDTVQQQVDEAIDFGLDGIMVYVDKKGQPPAFYTAGFMNRDKKIPADPQAYFKIASISKLYIAAATAKLAAAGQLSLDKRLAEYLPELADSIENSDKITLRLLVQHRSGIPNFTDQPEHDWANPPRSNKEALSYVLGKPADFAPDEKYGYCNTNYLLIGEILDKTLGYSHHDYIQEMLKPLGLHHTFSLMSEVDPDSLMSGYSKGWEYDVKSQDYIVPGGSMVATLQDVGVFLRALNDRSLLNEKEQEIYSSIYTYEHTGLLPGYQSIARYFKDIDTVVVQFVNTSGGNAWGIHEIVYKDLVKILRRG